MLSDLTPNETSESGEQSVGHAPPSDPSAWLDEHGDYLYRYAILRLRDATLAEDAVQETLLAALQSRHAYAGRSAERTWLTGILKHKIIDHFRKIGRHTQISQPNEDAFEHDELFRQEGEWVGHWEAERAPIEWHASPEDLLEQSEFFDVLTRCLSPLPERTRGAFTLREVEGLSSEEICEVLEISVNNLWVMLYRARMHLRRCLELNWFQQRLVRR
jgi:RNA polymerase sigma-70 factor, ECF subfamily